MPGWSLAVALAFLPGWLIPPRVVSALKATRVIGDESGCPRCVISLHRVTSLGTADGEGLIATPPNAVRLDGKNRYWVILGGPAAPLVFDSVGRFLQLAGRQGQGPGELLVPGDAFQVPGDSVVVLDAALRAHVISPELAHSRTIRMPRPLGPAVVLQWPGKVVLNGELPTLDGAGWPLHLASFAGNALDITRSFGPGTGELGAVRFETLLQHLAPSPRGGFWSTDWLQYRFYRWSDSGTMVAAFERRPEWFQPGGKGPLGTPETPPPSMMTGLAEDDAGRLWLFSRVAAPTWRHAWPRAAMTSSELPTARIAMEKMFRSVIEVVDPTAARVLARASVEDWILGVLPGGRVATYFVDSAGVARVGIVRYEIRQR